MITSCSCELCWMDIPACEVFRADKNVPTACAECWHDECCHINPLTVPAFSSRTQE